MQNVTGDRMLDEILAGMMPPGRPGPGGDDQPPAEGDEEESEDDAPA